VARVRQAQPAHAGGGQLVGDGPTDAADARDQHRGALEQLLACLAEAGNPQLPFVDGPLLVRQWPAACHDSPSPPAMGVISVTSSPSCSSWSCSVCSSPRKIRSVACTRPSAVSKTARNEA